MLRRTLHPCNGFGAYGCISPAYAAADNARLIRIHLAGPYALGMRIGFPRRSELGSFALLLWIGAQAPLVSSQAAPRTVLVPVEFRAVKNGVPVVDLKPQELILRVDGVERPVLALDSVRLGPDANAAPAPFATNIGTGRGRDVILVVDEESFESGAESRLRDALSEVLRLLTPRDRAGLVSLHASGPNVALTAQPLTVKGALPSVRARAIGTESASDLACRTRRVLPTLTSLLDGLDRGVLPTVLLFSAALAAPRPTGSFREGADGACLLLPNDFDEFRGAAARSAAQLFAIHLADASSSQQGPASAAGLERLAGEAGGQFLRVTGDPVPVMNRIVSDTAGFYVASIALEPASRGAVTRSVDVRVQREGVTTRMRPVLAMPPLESKTVSPRDMIRVPTGFRALPLRAAGFTSRDTGSSAKVVVLFEPIEPSVSLQSASAALFNAKGQLVAQWAGESQDLSRRPAMAGLAVAPGTYRLRVAAVDSIGRSGAVDDELRVELPAAGSLTTSGVVLGVSTTTGFSPRLLFTNADPKAAVYLEAYGAAPCTAVSAVLEIASSDLASQAPPLAKSTASSAQVDQSDACIIFGELDLAALPPGDHTIRVQLQLNGAVIGRRLHSLRKSGG